MREALAINYQIGPQNIQQHEKIVAAKLYGRRCEKENCFCVITEETNAVVGIGLRVPNPMGLVNYHQVKPRRRVQVK